MNMPTNMGLPGFPPEQQNLEDHQQMPVMDAMSLSSLQYRPQGNHEKFWSNTLCLDQQNKDTLGLGLGIDFNNQQPTSTMSMAAMAAAAAAGMSINNFMNHPQPPPPWPIMDPHTHQSMGVESLAIHHNTSIDQHFSTYPANIKNESGDTNANNTCAPNNISSQTQHWSPSVSTPFYNDHIDKLAIVPSTANDEYTALMTTSNNEPPISSSLSLQNPSPQSVETTENLQDHNHRTPEEDTTEKVPVKKPSYVYAYRECVKNLGADKGCVVHDGCCEFIPDDENDGSSSLICGACKCHRNFHRLVLCDENGIEVRENNKELDARATYDCVASIKKVANEVFLTVNEALSSFQKDNSNGNVTSGFSHGVEFLKTLNNLRGAAKNMQDTADCLTTLRASAAKRSDDDGFCSKEEDDVVTVAARSTGFEPVMRGAITNMGERREKRKRTRFSGEQINKLNDFAMEVGWTLSGLSKEDVGAVCENIGIEPTTLKYWLYNTRQKSKRKLQEDEISQTVSCS